MKDVQIILDEYEAFVEKFKPKKTTDDCYTPENVYEAIADWACMEYGIRREDIVRPFYPGGDYERFDYPENCCVLDNPPFSILAEIIRFYNAHNIRFFLFSPTLTILHGDFDYCRLITDADITYENGANVNTSFVTNLEREYIVRSMPELRRIIIAENKKNLSKVKKELPKYVYHAEVLTASMVNKMSAAGVDYRLKAKDALHIENLDAQKKSGKKIFGGGLLLSSKAAAEKAAAEKAAAEKAVAEKAVVWELSEREREWIAMLDAR